MVERLVVSNEAFPHGKVHYSIVPKSQVFNQESFFFQKTLLRRMNDDD